MTRLDKSDDLELVSLVSQCEHNLLEPPLDATPSFHCHQGPAIPSVLVDSLSTSMRAVPVTPLVLLSPNPVPINLSESAVSRKKSSIYTLRKASSSSQFALLSRRSQRESRRICFPHVKLQSLHIPQVSASCFAQIFQKASPFQCDRSSGSWRTLVVVGTSCSSNNSHKIFPCVIKSGVRRCTTHNCYVADVCL